MGLFTARGIRDRATTGARFISLLCTDLLRRAGRAGGFTFLRRFEFTVRVNAEIHAAALIEGLRLSQIRHQQNTGQ